MTWAIFDEQKKYILDFFVGTSDECWKYVAEQHYNCGKIGLMDKSAMELYSAGWKYVSGMWVNPESDLYSEL